MDKLKKFIDCYIDTKTCNLNCHYCYIGYSGKFQDKLMKLPHSPETIAKALSKERLGGCCLINLCAGGETLLSNDVIPLVQVLLAEGHYISIVTNGTLSKRFDELAEFSEENRERLFIKLSFHYLQLKERKMLDVFWNNVSKLKRAQISFTIEITSNDELIPYIDEVKSMCVKEAGAFCHVTIARDERTKEIGILSDYSLEENKKIWGSFNSELFDFKESIFYQKRNEYCHAGEWSLCINIVTGSVKQCYWEKEIDNIYEDMNRPIKTEAVGTACKLPHCYNGHAFLALGNIVELETPSYAELRNRIDVEGREWLQPKMKEFMSQKLGE